MYKLLNAVGFACVLAASSVAVAQQAGQMPVDPPAVSSSVRPAFAALSTATRQLQIRWLAMGCADGSDDYNGLLLRALKQPLDASFVEAWRLGPPADEIARLATTQHQAFAAFQARVAGPDARLFPQETVDELRAMSEDDYVSKAVTLSTDAYRQAALAGLALTATARVLPWLRETAPTLDGEARNLAFRAIRVAEGREAERR